MSAPVQIFKPIHRAPPKLPPPMPSPFRSLCWEFRDGWRSGRRRLGWFAPIPGQAWWYRVAYAAGFGVGRAVLWVRGKRPTGEEMEKWGRDSER